GINVAQGVRCGNPAEPVRIVHHRGEKIDGLNKSQIVADSVYPRILESFETDDHVGVLGDIYTAEYVREIVGAYFRRAPAEAGMMGELYIQMLLLSRLVLPAARLKAANRQKCRHTPARVR